MPGARDVAGFWWRPRASRAAIRGYQDRLIRRLVQHAARNVPYYQRLFREAGLRAEDVHGIGDLPLLPVSRKQQLQQVPIEDLLSPGVDVSRGILMATSGSTGQPLRIYRTRWEERILFAFRLRAQLLSGLRIGDRRVKLGSTPAQLLPHRLGLFPISNLALDLAPEEIIRRLRRLRPAVIYGVPHMLDLVAERITEQDLAVIRPRLPCAHAFRAHSG